ncbi:MAG TPA: T9SS type A sorting domain-containing protein [Ignavibacteriales bacterium]|nr:T9SS type A sorting domain-containing protein [Ignavibacteriales bacterium]
MKFKLLLLSVLLVSSFNFAQNYFPLEVGNEWHYTSGGKSPGLPYTQSSYVVSIVEKKLMPNGKEYYKQSEDIFSTTYHYFRYDSSKLFAYNEAENKELILFDFVIPDSVDEDNYNGIFRIDTLELFGADEIILNFRNGCTEYSFNKKYGLIGSGIPQGCLAAYYDVFAHGCKISGVQYGSIIDYSGYLPLTIGNKWFYKREYKPDGTAVIIDTVELKVINKKAMSNSLEYFEFSQNFPNTNYKYARTDSCELYFYDTVSDTEILYRNFSHAYAQTYSQIGNKGFTAYQYYPFSVPEPVVSYIKGVGLASYSSSYYNNNTAYLLIGFELADSTYGFINVADDYENPIVTDYELEQNYPNPFNPETNISVVLPKSGYVKLTVYDLTGREISKLYQGELTSGRHNFKFSGSALSSGIYFYRLESAGLTQTKKMLLLK